MCFQVTCNVCILSGGILSNGYLSVNLEEKKKTVSRDSTLKWTLYAQNLFKVENLEYSQQIF